MEILFSTHLLKLSSEQNFVENEIDFYFLAKKIYLIIYSHLNLINLINYQRNKQRNY